MRWGHAVLVLCISLLSVGLQAAPGPFVLCTSKCEIRGSGETVEMVCWAGPEASGCCIVVDDADCSDAEQEIDVSEMGCCVADASCTPADACPLYPVDSDQNCPYQLPDCYYCLPGRILADKTPQSDRGPEFGNWFVAVFATSQLALADGQRQVSHAHSPPTHLWAATGSDICIQICLLLI